MESPLRMRTRYFGLESKLGFSLPAKGAESGTFGLYAFFYFRFVTLGPLKEVIQYPLLFEVIRYYGLLLAFESEYGIILC